MYANFVELESLMLYAKFQDHGTSGSLLIYYLLPHKKSVKGFYFYHIWVWRPSWSCDLDHL